MAYGTTRPLVAGLAILLWPGAMTSAMAFCVENQDPARVFFVVEPAKGAGQRQAFWLDSGQKVCDNPGSGDIKIYVYVYASEDDLEGCSRIAAANQTVRLDRLDLYDRCAWTVAP